ncbi:MAG: AmmeMemoRadiSam system protein A [Coprothermobacterota bacterium]|nr:AmmeMemoRadiSam system protein A [Coprothermobacterota bacterium]
MVEHPLVRLARLTIAAHLEGAPVERVQISLPPDLPARAAVFVSLHRGSALRGCIGTLEPQTPSLREEVIANAISASTRDPRFPSVKRDEVDTLEISVDVLTPPEPIDEPTSLDTKRYGVIVQSGWRRGVLLPDLEGVDTVERQVQIARTKAGIGQHEPVRLYRFEVRRYH